MSFDVYFFPSLSKCLSGDSLSWDVVHLCRTHLNSLLKIRREINKRNCNFYKEEIFYDSSLPFLFRRGYSEKLFRGFLFSVHHSKVNFWKVPKPPVDITSSGSMTQVVLLWFNDRDDADTPQRWCLMTSAPFREAHVTRESALMDIFWKLVRNWTDEGTLSFCQLDKKNIHLMNLITD